MLTNTDGTDTCRRCPACRQYYSIMLRCGDPRGGRRTWCLRWPSWIRPFSARAFWCVIRSAAPVFWRTPCCSATAVIFDLSASSIIRSHPAVFHLGLLVWPRGVPEGVYSVLLKPLYPHQDSVRTLHRRVGHVLSALLVVMHHVHRGHPPDILGSFSFRYARLNSSLDISAMRCVK